MQIKTLAPTALAVAVTGLVGGIATKPAVESAWYAKLRKPPFQPPRQAFPIAWTSLYADIAVVSAATLDEAPPELRRGYIRALAVNLVLNGGWSWLFFNRRKLGASAVTAGLLAASSADLTRRAVAVRGAKAAPLGLYPLWCTFATVLSTSIWALNRR
ncbi:TspO/MBR family protein [Mycolicibacterium diernhoferi]|uniref:Tryptophan-rich sensory protein n=1 Tax=Mycolicibacterium diernhoferi TaxID=1801 RepID=A0A1Q4HD03_9MYCO|nr:TspO/MBR family protein [Mycolicibacterium diernhoferi]OJZ65261.1 TspO protein [Mycolicibacterium diernhoferi]OPE46218.1 TspO protein [Mycolicibacterium diernhoferi]PEG52296.1 tryptophan-rich sensory protein [Mycolicibacterium diernhoferi]QYL25386.1 tryptophan-rich sensory protein [Mycolicibacterium diernhoferi]